VTVTYLPPVGLVHAQVGASLEVETVRSGPAYCRTRSATRWHLIRHYRRTDVPVVVGVAS
jgi:hypothetical protein